MEASQAAIQDTSRTSQRAGNNYSRLFAMSTLAQLPTPAAERPCLSSRGMKAAFLKGRDGLGISVFLLLCEKR